MNKGLGMILFHLNIDSYSDTGYEVNNVDFQLSRLTDYEEISH